jgi:hypothetical protein
MIKIKKREDIFMNSDLRKNYLSLILLIFIIFFEGFMYFLFGEQMVFLLKICIALTTFSCTIVIVLNIVDIIKKVRIKDKG